MTALDVALVDRWFDRLRSVDPSAIGAWGVRPTSQELAALEEGRIGLGLAVRDLPAPAAVVELTEVPALMLRDYLAGFAAGVSEARRLLAVEPSVDLFGGLDPGADAGGALALAAGLNAAAAALTDPDRDPRRSGFTADGPTAAESARSAGVSAAELVVDGADLHRIAAVAAGAAGNGWRVGLPPENRDGERADYRDAPMVVKLLWRVVFLRTRT